MNKKKLMILSLTALFTLSCTSEFSEMNRDKYGATDEDLASTPIGSSDLQNQNIYAVANQENAWQMYNDLVGIYSGFCASSGFSDDFNAYAPRTGWNDYPFDDNIKHLYQGYNPIKSKSKGNMDVPAFALSTISRVAVIHRLSDIYGPMPYSQVNGIELQVPYDSQKDLYKYMLEDLKAATESLDKVPKAYDLYAPFDMIYKGDLGKWAKFGRSLMLRMAVRIAKKEPNLAKEYAEYAVAHGVISSNEESAQMISNDNPCYKVSVLWGDSRVGADIVEYMEAFNDPRSSAYFTTIPERGNRPFGLRIGATKAFKGSKLYSCPNIKGDSPMMWMSAAEVTFLMAEGALNGWNMNGKSAEELYKKGIQLSFDQWGVKMGNYLESTSKRGAFYDQFEPSLNNSSFSSDITVNWEDANGDYEKQLSKIITQKWIALFPYGTMEAWTEWRRTGYPNLMPSLNNKSSDVKDIVQVDGKDTGGMRRLKFSSQEISSNGANVKKAIEDLGGPDSYATDLWWAK